MAGLLATTPALAGDEARQGESASSRKGGASGPDRAGSTSTSGEVDSSAAGASQSTKGSGSAAKHEVVGKVERFDSRTRTLEIEGSERKLKLTDDTKVMKDGNRADVKELREGVEVRARFSPQAHGQAAEALVVEIVSPMEQGNATGATPSPAPEHPPGKR